MLIVADIGGTYTKLAAAAVKDGKVELRDREVYASARDGVFEDILGDYLGRYPGFSAKAIGISAAGAIEEDKCHLTNLDMTVDRIKIGERFGVENTFLVNDLYASGCGLGCLSSDSLISINRDGAAKDGNRVLVSPGTGLGEAIVHYTEGKYVPLASEGGHVDFAPFNGDTVRLWNFLKSRRDRVAVEDILSGSGIYNIFSYVTSESGIDIDAEMKKNLQGEPGPAITALAVAGESKAAVRSVALFLDVLAAEAGNMALKAMAVGGIYIGGGIVPKLVSLIDHERFCRIFSDKGIHSRMLKKMPVYVITDTALPLYGMACYVCAQPGVDTEYFN